MSDYRITHNGIDFHVECLHHRHFLWWKWTKWSPVYRISRFPNGDDYIASFNTYFEAEEAIKLMRKEDKAKVIRYVPVLSSPNDITPPSS